MYPSNIVNEPFASYRSRKLHQPSLRGSNKQLAYRVLQTKNINKSKRFEPKKNNHHHF